MQALPQQIILISNNLPSGYFRDLQIIKEVFLPSFDELKECIQMIEQMISVIEINKNILNDEKYALIFSVEEVNRLVLSGRPFRDAYKQVGLDIENGQSKFNKQITHTHEGSIGNLCNEQIVKLKQEVIYNFDFDKFLCAEKKLLTL